MNGENSRDFGETYSSNTKEHHRSSQQQYNSCMTGILPVARAVRCKFPTKKQCLQTCNIRFMTIWFQVKIQVKKINFIPPCHMLYHVHIWYDIIHDIIYDIMFDIMCNITYDITHEIIDGVIYNIIQMI